jgi:hypothetical protein
MGLRATVIKKYEVEYGNANGFNYDPDTLNNIISEFCEDYYCGDDGYGGCSTDAYWEIDKRQFEDMLDELRDMDTKEFNERMKEDWFSGTFSDDKPYSKKYVLEVFQGWLDETPENSNYVRIGWL